MARSKTPTCCLTLPLKVEPWQADVLNKRMEVCRNIYNSYIGYQLKQYEQLIRTRAYRSIIEEIDSYRPIDENGNKKGWEKGKKKPERVAELYKELNALYKEWGFTEFGFIAGIKKFRQHFKGCIDSATAVESVARPAWVAFEKFLFSNGEKVHFKKQGEVNTLCSGSDKVGPLYRDGYVEWKKNYKDYLKIKVVLDKNNQYEEEMLSNRIKYCRIVRRWIKGKYQYFAQIVLECQPVIKYDSETGELKHPLGSGRVGLFVGVKNIAYCSESAVGVVELADKVDDIEAERRRLLRHLERSRRATNPDNYNEDGTIKKGVKLNWVASKEYEESKGKLKELYRKQADVRKLQHNILANQLLILGDEFYINKTDYKKLQQRAEFSDGHEKTASGKNKSKKRFGKTISDKAPSMFVNILDNKLKQYGRPGVLKVDLKKNSTSEFVHTTGEYIEVKPYQKYIDVDGHRVSRDLYFAFLLMNSDGSFANIDLERCSKTFNRFLELQEI